MKDSAKRLGAKIHGAYVCPNEHTFCFVLEADKLELYPTFSDPQC